MQTENIWGKISFEENERHQLKIGNLTLLLKSENDISSFKLFENGKDAEEGIWNRLIGKAAYFSILPALPERTLVLKPKNNLSISSGTTFKFYVYLPTTFQLFSGDAKPENKVFEHALKDLSSTWFGETNDGELCYVLYSSFDTTINARKTGSSFVVCPIEIANRSKEILEVKRLAVRCMHLNIYSDGHMLISNKVKINYHGLETISDIRFDKNATSSIPKLKLLTKARVPEDKTIFKRSFQLIRHITQF